MDSDRIKFLLKAISNNDQSAFEQFFDHYYPKLIQFALAFVPGILDAQEVVSDVLFKLLKKPKLIEKISNFDNYMFLAVRNQSFNYLKKNRRRFLHDSIDCKEDYILPATINPEDSLIANELYELLAEAIETLPHKRKIIFKLVKEEGKKYREVAELLNVSEKTFLFHPGR